MPDTNKFIPSTLMATAGSTTSPGAAVVIFAIALVWASGPHLRTALSALPNWIIGMTDALDHLVSVRDERRERRLTAESRRRSPHDAGAAK
jgi:hypothetical protein